MEPGAVPTVGRVLGARVHAERPFRANPETVQSALKELCAAGLMWHYVADQHDQDPTLVQSEAAEVGHFWG